MDYHPQSGLINYNMLFVWFSTITIDACVYLYFLSVHKKIKLNVHSLAECNFTTLVNFNLQSLWLSPMQLCYLILTCKRAVLQCSYPGPVSVLLKGR